MADEIDGRGDAQVAREELGLSPDRGVLALLPGSRMSEVGRLAQPMLEAAALIRQSRPSLQVITALANERVAGAFESILAQSGVPDVNLIQGRARSVIAAADVVLCASGTATLETLLINRPMVMAYKLAPATYFTAKNFRLIKRQFFALPNILAKQALIPELIQDEVTPGNLAKAANVWLDDPEAVRTLQLEFDNLHQKLRCGASSRAAAAASKFLPSAL
jgi:lipid-A-disaccharide synthase